MQDGAGAVVAFEHVTKRYGGPESQLVVNDLTFTVPAGEICVLVGPSGSGKTTTMKMVNRLIEPSGGRITVGGRDVQDLPAVELRRRIGYVIQQVGLFPHRTIRDNIATVPKLLGWDKKRTGARVDELCELVGLDPSVLRRYPAALSGGQQQRVGVARALASDPNILLMDEPFGAVDPIVRADLQIELNRLQRELGKTIVFVTHDIDEAFTLADQVVIFAKGGVIAQAGTPAEILANPANAFVASFIGADKGGRDLFLQQRSGDGGLTLVVDADGRPVGVLDAGSAETPRSGSSAT